ncbi:class I SAM-dependent methyltransferase [bacterium]|nr:class I SAM-dependent methyltransferase [bacterium]QQR56810.1 MAG: class I SAM-dependent methyltransferase [Candidatus Melainabacteria bacterium]
MFIHLDEHYINPKLAEIYDLDSPWSKDRDFYLSLAGDVQKRILDLGCGTGLLCDAYAAKGHNVTGVDPAEAMLKIARQKKHGKEITWIQSKAQDFKSEYLFDLIIMTGHAFQVLLQDREVECVFRTMKEHLKPEGSIVFESRNPNIDWKSKWDYEITLDTPYGLVQESRRYMDFVDDKMTFRLEYKFADETLTSQSVLRFWTKEQIEMHLSKACLTVDTIYGDWSQSPFSPEHSEEMIFKIGAG